MGRYWVYAVTWSLDLGSRHPLCCRFSAATPKIHPEPSLSFPLKSTWPLGQLSGEPTHEHSGESCFQCNMFLCGQDCFKGFIDSIKKKKTESRANQKPSMFAEQERVSLYRLVKPDTYRNYQYIQLAILPVEANDKQYCGSCIFSDLGWKNSTHIKSQLVSMID